MSVETTGALAVLKYAWSGLFLPLFWWVFKKQDKIENEMKDNYYTKDEIEKQITLHNQPVIQDMQNIKELLKEVRDDVKKINKNH